MIFPSLPPEVKVSVYQRLNDVDRSSLAATCRGVYEEVLFYRTHSKDNSGSETVSTDRIPSSSSIIPIKAKNVDARLIEDPVNTQNDHRDVVTDKELNVLIEERYQVTPKVLGEGTFGAVVEAYDMQKRTKCAIKFVKYKIDDDASTTTLDQRATVLEELRVLRTLYLNDPQNHKRCIHLRDCFDFRNQICIVTDLLSQSLFDFLKGNESMPFPSSQIQSFARQLFTSVEFLHDLHLIHTDLKPHNILLVSNASRIYTYKGNTRRVLLDTEIRLIDFGSATFDDEEHEPIVTTRYYRAPEIILDLGWSYPCDVWSVGCILVELFTGVRLFKARDTLLHLEMMESVCAAKIEPELAQQIQGTGRSNSRNHATTFFTRGLKLNHRNQETSKASKKKFEATKSLPEVIPAVTAFNKEFLDVLRRIFVINPKQRLTAEEALKHQWFKEKITDDGTRGADQDVAG